jgi:hypothetical protein
MLARTDKKKTAPSVGTPVSLLSQDDGCPFAATVMTWANSAESLVVSTRVAVGREAVRQLADGRVLVSVPEPRGFTMFGGVARFAPAENEFTISVPDREPRQLRAVDLSRGGVRVALSNPTDLVLGEKVTVEVHLEDGTSIPASGAVTRLDERAGRATVRFDELPSDDGARMDKLVLRQLTTAG